MSNVNTDILSVASSWVSGLRNYRVGVILGLNFNPFTWSWTGDWGKNCDEKDRDVYFVLLGLTIVVGIYRKGEK